MQETRDIRLPWHCRHDCELHPGKRVHHSRPKNSADRGAENRQEQNWYDRSIFWQGDVMFVSLSPTERHQSNTRINGYLVNGSCSDIRPELMGVLRAPLSANLAQTPRGLAHHTQNEKLQIYRYHYKRFSHRSNTHNVPRHYALQTIRYWLFDAPSASH